MDTKRRRHQRLFRDYSAHRFRRVFHHTHNTPHTTHHTHTSQVLGWTPGDEGTDDHVATIRPIGFAVYFTTHTQHNTHHTPHTHTHITGTWVDTRRRRHQRLFRDYSAHRFRRVCHHTHNTRHTTHTHTHITGTWVDTRRRRHQRRFRDYSAHRFRRVFHHTHTTQYTPHTPHTSQVLGWTPGDEGTNDYFATIRPIGFAVYFG